MLNFQQMGIFMDKYFDILRRCALFDQIADSELDSLLKCLGVKAQFYKKEESIFAEGAPATQLGILLSGSAKIVRVDYYGNRSILTQLEPADIFGESFACAGAKHLPVSIVANSDCEALMIDINRITHSCSNACQFHSQIIFNLLNLVARKNIIFNEKIEITSMRSTRNKLMAYLLMRAKEKRSNDFQIPFDRQELADYLEVDRSGLSAEISKLRREGVLKCRRSHFTIK